MIKNSTLRLAVISVFGLVLGTSPAFSQGSLTPPGPPAPMMKTLQQVEPRTDVLTLPSGGFNAQFAIIQPGSYYLTTNIIGVSNAGLVGIIITANNVTLDLNGFSMIGNGSLFSGIWLYGPNGQGATNVVVLNGIVTGWGNAGIWADTSYNCRFERLTLVNNGVVNQNPGLRGVVGSHVLNCIAVSNSGAGISVNGMCVVENNICNTNGLYGIYTTGMYNRIEANQAMYNASYGIVVASNSRSLIVKNMAGWGGRGGSSGYYSGYNIIPGNTYGPIIYLTTGQIATPATGWENFDDYTIP